jgi:hypothetical protein
VVPIFGSDVWQRLTAAERTRLRHHFQAWQLSQFLHGEQGALVCTAKIVQQIPAMDAKFYASTQVIDEARHVEAYMRLLHEKYELVYPINPFLKQLLDDTLSDSRWDFTYLGMQVLIEGVALAAFGVIRDQATNPLARSVTAVRHAGRGAARRVRTLALRDYYPQLTDKERDEREEFVVEGCYLLRDRFLGAEVWETLGLPVDECTRYTDGSELMRIYRSALFARIVPTIKGHRALGAARAEGVRGHGHPRVRRRRLGRVRAAGRGRRARDGRAPRGHREGRRASVRRRLTAPAAAFVLRAASSRSSAGTRGRMRSARSSRSGMRCRSGSPSRRPGSASLRRDARPRRAS